MYTDMVGYTALGQRNESLSLALVDEQRKLIRPILARHNGAEVKTIGDGFLVEFPNALDSVRCAYDIQRATREFNISLPAEKRIHLRVGLHLGDVVRSEGDISGDAVNVASRIEPLAEDGGVCLTRQVYDHVHNKFDVPLTSLGPKSLKNVSEPVEVYKMIMPWEKESAGWERLDARRLAILPFVSLSPDPNDEYFADGLTEELITRASFVKGLEVIARTSVMGFKKKDRKVSEIAKELKVGSLLEGSVRKAGNRIRVTAQLISAETEGHLWAENYDRDLTDIFQVQSSVAENVAAALKLRLLDAEKERIESRGPKNPEAYQEYLKGMYFAWKFDEENNRKSIWHLERALELEPQYAEAMALLGGEYGYMGYAGYDPMDETIPKGRELIIRALQLDEKIPMGHFQTAVYSHYFDRDWEKAEKEYKRTLEFNPNFAAAHNLYAFLLSDQGRTQESMTEIQKSLDLDPLSAFTQDQAGSIFSRAERLPEALAHFQMATQLDPDLGHGGAGFVLFKMGKAEEGIKELEKDLAIMKSSFSKGILGYVYAVTGRREEALKLADEIRASSKKGGASGALAEIFAGLGEKDQALDWLEKAYEEHSLGPGFRRYRSLASLRDEPRFKELVKKMGLDKYQSA